MAWDVSGRATETYDVPQLTGELFMEIGLRPNALLRAIGGLQGGVRTIRSNEYVTAVTRAVEAPAQPAIVEGADPTYEARSLTQDTNVVQIFQEGVELTFSATSNDQELGGLAVIPGIGQGGKVDPASFEFQELMHLEAVQNDMNYSFLAGAYAQGSQGVARKTRGLANAITSNVDEASGVGRDLTKSIFEGLLKTAIDAQNIPLGANLFAFCDSSQFENLSDLYEDETQKPESRTVAGLAVTQIVTKWGIVNLIYEPDTPDVGGGGGGQGSIVLARLPFIRPVAREITAKGVRYGLLFVDDSVAHTGSSFKEQIYGEWGIDYGAEELHARIDDLNA